MPETFENVILKVKHPQDYRNIKEESVQIATFVKRGESLPRIIRAGRGGYGGRRADAGCRWMGRGAVAVGRIVAAVAAARRPVRVGWARRGLAVRDRR